MLNILNTDFIKKSLKLLAVSSIQAFLFVCVLYTYSFAGWLIDEHKYRLSVHSDVTCVGCHSDIGAEGAHPIPSNVARDKHAVFDPETCFSCHDDVQTQIESDALHGGQKVADIKRFLNCVECHSPHDEGAAKNTAGAAIPDLMNEDHDCMECHRKLNSSEPGGIEKNRDFCFTCHGDDRTMPSTAPVILKDEYQSSLHYKMDCMACHTHAADYKHNRQITADCIQCHEPHEESVAHEAHSGVSCGACHLEDIIPEKDNETGLISWKRIGHINSITGLHNFTKPDESGCVRCHYSGNQVGAASLILPSKSVLCMPCHPSTLSAKDTTTLISLVIFVIGCIAAFSILSSCSSAPVLYSEGKKKTSGAFLQMIRMIFTLKSGILLNTFCYDILFQRRLFKRSAKRWIFHSLIFWPIVIRFSLGLAGLFFSTFFKSWPLAWILINKNHPFTAFIFDLTGLCLLVGCAAAIIRNVQSAEKDVPGLPGRNSASLFLLGGIITVGFLLEGLRIAMTGAEGAAAYAFLGYPVSRLFSGMNGLNDWYAYIWYLHAILTGMFIAYLPFSRMMHIIMSPVVMLMNAVDEKKHSGDNHSHNT